MLLKEIFIFNTGNSVKFYMEWNLLKVNGKYLAGFSSFQSLSHIWLFVTPWTATLQASLCRTNSRGLLKLMSIEVVMPSNHITFCHPFLFPNSIFPSITLFPKESDFCIKWPKHWSFSFGTRLSNQYSGLISLRIDWIDPLANQGTLKSLLQHNSSKASMLQHFTFFMVHSHIRT